MAVSTVKELESLPASADLSSYQYRIMKIGTTGKITYATAATDKLIGVLQDKPNADGVHGAVACVGVGRKSKVVYGGTVTAGDKLTTDSVGRAIKAVVVGSVILGRAAVSGVSGDIGEVLLGEGGSALRGKISATVGAESSNAIDVVCSIVDEDGNAIASAREVFIRTLAVTADKGDLAAATSAVGTLNKTVNPATGENVAHMTTTAGGLFSFKVSNDVAEVTGVHITAESCEPLVLKLTFT